MSDLDLLRDLTTDIQPPLFDDLVATARRRDRQTAALTVAGCLVVGVAVVAGAIWARSATPTSPQPIGPLPRITVHPVEEPAGQSEVTADIGPDDLGRWEEVETHTTETGPGATRIHKTLQTPSYFADVRGFCRGEEETWWIVYTSKGAGDYGQCSPDGALTATPPTDVAAADVSDGESIGASHVPWSTRVTMLATGPIPQQNQDCFDLLRETSSSGFDDCVKGLQELPKTSATFGFTMYVDRAPDVANVTGEGFEALAVIDGQDYTYSRGILGAPGALSLAVNLSPSDRARLVGIRSPDHADQVSVLVDGKPAVDGDEPPSMAPADALTTATLVPPGFHTVQVQLTEREVEMLMAEGFVEPGESLLAVVIYEATP